MLFRSRMSQLEPRGDNWILLNLFSRALDPSVIDEDALEIEITKALLIARKEAKFTTDKVAVSLPITSAVVKVINIPLLSDTELSIAVENGSLWTNTIQLPEDLSFYSVFWQILARDEAKNQMAVLTTTLFPTNAAQVQAFAGALYGVQVGSATMAQVTADITAAGGLNNALNAYYTASFGSAKVADVGDTVAANIGLTEIGRAHV